LFKRLNPPLIIAIVLIAVAGIGFFTALTNEQNRVNVMVAKTTLHPFIAIQSSDIGVSAVSRSSLTPDDLTQADYKSLYTDFKDASGKAAPRDLIPTFTILNGQRIDKAALVDPARPQQSFSIVLPDERVVAASSSVSGADLGVVQPGAVVDVQTAGSGSDQVISSFAKVLCISSDPNGCTGVLGGGQKPTLGKVKAGLGSSSTGAVQILLALSQGDASQIAGQQVSLSLNTYCSVDQFGFFVSVQTGLRCQAPAGRMASDATLRKKRESQSAPAATTTTPGTNGGTTTSLTTTTTGTGTTPGSQNGVTTSTTTTK
jgi:hypothetical protein